MISTGMYLTKLLEAYGVDTVFGIPGVHTVELYRGLAGNSIRHITPRHEQGAGFMADGYARISGKPGVCFIITGPGMTNIATAMGQAYGDSIPMLVISTVNSHGRMGSGEGWLHELPNQQAVFDKLAAFSLTVNAPEQLAPALARAFAVFDSARPRPVHIELPINVMLAPADHLPIPARPARMARPEASAQDLHAAADLLTKASRPIILAGGGAVWASDAIRALAEKLDAPVVMTINARGILPPRHPLGLSLSATFAGARSLIAEADVVLAIGTELGPTDYDMFEDGGLSMPGKLIRVDIDPAQAIRNAAPALAIIADAGKAASAIAELVTKQDRGAAARVEKAAACIATDLTPPTRGDLFILDAVRDALPDAVFVGDSTQLVYSGNSGYASARPSSWFNSATGYGTLGYGLPAALGAKAADPMRPVIALVGDGGLQFSISEMAVARESGLPVALLLLENGGYGEIRSYMIARDIPPLGVDLYAPDFAKIAEGYGWRVSRASTLDDLIELTVRAASAPEPTLVLFGEDVRAEAARRVMETLTSPVESSCVP